MKISGLEHLFLRVADPARSLRFYRDVLGLPCEQQGTETAPELLTVRLGGGVSLVLSAAHGAEPARPAGIALSLQVEDPDVFAREATGRGIELTQPPHDTHWQTRMCAARDPDGLELHFERPLERPRD